MPETARPKSGNATDSRVGIIQAVQTPLGVFVLLVLAIEALLALVITRLPATAVGSVVWAMIGLLALVVLAFFGALIYRPELLRNALRKEPEAAAVPVLFKYDVFLSAPMAAYSGKEEFLTNNKEMIRLVDVLRNHCHVQTVYYAGEAVKKWEDWELTDASLEKDTEALRQSRIFVMVYPKKVPSSVLIEAGFALALGKPSIYFAGKEGLPFLLRGSDKSKTHKIRIEEFDGYDALCKFVSKNWDKIQPA